MSTQDLDMAAIMAAANDALAQPGGSTASLGVMPVTEAHQCQTGCGRLANVIMVRIADSDLDILCDVCAMMMFMAIAQEALQDAPADPSQAPTAGTMAVEVLSVETGVDGQAASTDDESTAADAAPAPES